MRSEYRATLFCGVLFVGVPALYALGDWLAGVPLALLLPAGAALASFLYMRGGDRTPPGSPAAGASAPSGVRPPATPVTPAGLPPAGGM